MVSKNGNHRVMHRKEAEELYLFEPIKSSIYFTPVAPQTIYKIGIFDRLVYSLSN
jgi:hypothetical protein